MRVLPSVRYVALFAAIVGTGLVVSGPRTPARQAIEDGIAKPPPRTAPIEPLAEDRGAGSAMLLATIRDRRVLLVVDEDEDAVHTLDVRTRLEIARTRVPGKPAQLAITRDGKLAIARRNAAEVSFFVATLADAPLELVGTLPTADEPLALAVHGDTLHVLSGAGRALEVFDLASNTKRFELALGREPRSLAISDDGGRAFVGYAGESALGVLDLRAKKADSVSLVRPPKQVISEDCFKCDPEMIPARFARQAFSFAHWSDREGEHIVAPHELVTPGEPRAETSGYGANDFEFDPVVFDLARVDLAKDTVSGLAPLHRRIDCPLPRAAVHDAPSDTLFVACVGSSRVAAVNEKEGAAAFIPAPGGPIALALDRETRVLFVASQFDRVVRAHLLDDPSVTQATMVLSHEEGAGLSFAAAEGRRVFHFADVAVSRDGRACASCHPDGRDDGLVWPTPGGPRQTIFLAGRVSRTGAFGWEAKHTSLVDHMGHTIQNLGGNGLSKDSFANLAAYLRTLEVPPHKPRTLDSLEAKGRSLFASKRTRCSTCHVPENGFTDGDAHDVWSGMEGDATQNFIAPSLHAIGASAPYFHDGRYATLGDMLRDPDSGMMPAEPLRETEIRALEAYLRTL